MIRILLVLSLVLTTLAVGAQNPCTSGPISNIGPVLGLLPSVDGSVAPAGIRYRACGRVQNITQARTLTIRNVQGTGPVIDLEIYSGSATDLEPTAVVLTGGSPSFSFDFTPLPNISGPGQGTGGPREPYGIDIFFGASGSFQIAITPLGVPPVDDDFADVGVEGESLPVNWVDKLSYRPFGEQIRLEYSVSDQVDVSGYELEAYAGTSFEPVKRIDYIANGALETRYSVLTQWPTEATYYRIKQFDHDGSYDYSNVIFVPGQSGTAEKLMLFPNPASNTVRMTVPEAAKQVDLIDASGRLMQSYDADLARAGIDVSGVAEGMYFIRTVGAEIVGSPQRLLIRH